MTGEWLTLDQQRRAAAEAAIAEIQPGMVVGLGTGRTAAFATAALGQRVADGLSVHAVATSMETAERAAAAGIPVLDMEDFAVIDLDIDGVDEIDPGFRAIKGAGGAMLREKVIAQAARRAIAIADSSKAVAQIGTRPVPVEILPLAQTFVAGRIRSLVGTPLLRLDDHGAPRRTDQGNFIFDCSFGLIHDPATLAAAIETIPGAVGHGLFVTEFQLLYLGTADGVVRKQRP
jgi:ribose 5-phosphate isomerase A